LTSLRTSLIQHLHPRLLPRQTPTPTPGGGNNGNGGDADFKERYSGTIQPGQSSVEISFSLRRSGLDAKINQNHGNQQIYFELLDANGNLIAIAEDDQIELRNLAPGNYVFRIRGNVTKAVDFTIKCEQDD
jgi:hypothetical protein